MVITDAQRERFNTFGFLNLPGVFDSAEVARLGAIHDRLIAMTGDGPQRPEDCAVANPLLLVDDYLPFFDDDRITGLADALIGEDCIYYADSAITQAMRPTPWHDDGPSPFLDAIKISIYLDPVEADTGCLVVLPGSHHSDAFLAYRTAFTNGLDPLDPDIPGATPLPSRPGDVQVFWRRLWHSTWESNRHRRQLQINFSARPSSPMQRLVDWHWQLRVCALDGWLWRSGYRLFSDEFLETAGPRRLRKVEPYLDRRFDDPGRPAPTEANLELFRRP
jgi:Phytanoyl-CoA dioxygenase (PhyH)